MKVLIPLILTILVVVLFLVISIILAFDGINGSISYKNLERPDKICRILAIIIKVLLICGVIFLLGCSLR